MSRNGSGTYSLPTGNPVVTGTVISSTAQNNTMSDVATALTNSLAANGETPVTANLPMASFKHTGVANAAARTDYAAYGQVQDGAPNYVATVGGTADVITLTPAPAITTYTAGQEFSFITSGTNTTNVTVAISGLAAKAITKTGTVALAAGDIQSGWLITIRYDGTQFQVIPSFLGTNIFSGNTFLKGTIPSNLRLTPSVASNALTIALKGNDGNDPSATNPVYVPFRNVTAATGDTTWLTITAATSLVISSGSTMGTTSGVINRLWIVAFNDGGTFILGAVNCLITGSTGTNNIYPLANEILASSTAEGGAGAADSAGVIYTGTAVSAKAMIILGYVESTQATAGTWATTPSKTQLFNQGVSLPGRVIQQIFNRDATYASNSAVIPTDDTIPQISEGTEFFNKAITPTSAANLLVIEINGQVSASASAGCTFALFQDSTADALSATSTTCAASNLRTLFLDWSMQAATASSTTFRLRFGPDTVTMYVNGTGGRLFGGSEGVTMKITELCA